MAIFTNQATLSYRGTVINSNVVTGEIVEALSITKTPLSTTYSPDGVVTYVVNIVNSGAAPANNLTLTDNLGAYTFGTGELVPLTYVDGSVAYFVNGVPAQDPTVADVSPLVITGVDVPVGNVTVVYQAAINEFAPLPQGSEITNTVIASGGVGGPVSASATVTASAAPNLDITKALTPTSVGENGQITYTFTVRNYGNTATVATDDVVLRDTFDPVLDVSSVTFNGAAWAEGVQYNYNSTTGLFETVAGEITVPAATYVQDAVTGAWTVIPGESVLTVVGTI